MAYISRRKTNTQTNNDGQPQQLHELLQSVAEVVNRAFSSSVWVVAEVSELHVAAQGHCYLQLIEKDATRGITLASVRGTIWANRWWMVSEFFAQQTGQPLASGMKVMLEVQVQMHEQYGLSLNVLNIDPTYTLGEMARRRLEIIRRLEQEGIIDMNRELPFPTLPQRIAIVSAEGAAGYGDFVKQLSQNSYGLQFYCHLFPAAMQGQQTEASVIAALERIYQHQELFDVVVIIRGGGAVLDLASFDSYDLALNIANFPLPVIAGIGHDRDQTVVDRVAHTSVKTPTAAAARLIDLLGEQLQHLMDLEQTLRDAIRNRTEREKLQMQRLTNAVRGTHTTLTQLIGRLDMTREKVELLAHQRLTREQDRLRFMEQTIQMAQPDNILKRGFSITRLDGHAVRSSAAVPSGARLEIQTADGTLSATAE